MNTYLVHHAFSSIALGIMVLWTAEEIGRKLYRRKHPHND